MPTVRFPPDLFDIATTGDVPGVNRLYPARARRRIMSDATAAPAPAAAEHLDAEDQMAAELATLRQERAAEGSTAAAPSPAPAPAPADAADAAAAAPAIDTTTPPTGSAAPAPAATPAPAPGAAPATDPAELLRRTQEELQKARSEMGRVGQLNRLLNETRAERDRLNQENAILKKAAPSPEQKLGEDAAAKLAALAERAKGFPELEGLVGAVQDALKASQAQVEAAARQTVETGLAPLQTMRAEQAQRQQEATAAAYEAAMQTFQATYPNAVDVIRTAEFSAWIRSQPQPTQQAFQRGQTPDEAMVVMDAYDAHLRRSGKPPIAVYPQQPATSNAPAAQQQPAAAQRSSANAARLNAAAGLPSRASGAKGGMPPEDDFEANVEYFRQQRLAKQQRAA